MAPNIRTRESPIAPHRRHAPTAPTKNAPTMIAVNSPAQLPRNNAPSGAIAPRYVGAEPVTPNQFGDQPTRYARAASSGDIAGSSNGTVWPTPLRPPQMMPRFANTRNATNARPTTVVARATGAVAALTVGTSDVCCSRNARR